MDMQAHRKKKAGLRLKSRAEAGDERARELLNRSGFNRTPMTPDTGPKLTGGETLMRGHDVEDRAPNIPHGQLMAGMVDRNTTKPADKAGVMPFATAQNYVTKEPNPPMQAPPRRKKIFARDPNYNFSPATPAPSGPGTKQTNAVVGSPKKSLKDGYPAGGPGGVSDGVSGPMSDGVHGATTSSPAPSNFSHRNEEYAGTKAPAGIGTQEGKGKKSLAEYPGTSGRAGMQGGQKDTVIGHAGTTAPKKRKHKLGARGMAFIGRQGPGKYSEGSAVA